MSTEPDRDGRHSLLLTIGAVALPLACCGLPALLAAGGLGVLGSVIRNVWVIGAAALVVVGVIIWRRRTRPAGAGSTCCAPNPNEAADNSGSGSRIEER